MEETTSTGADPSGGVSVAEPVTPTVQAPENVAAPSGGAPADVDPLDSLTDAQQLRDAFKARLAETAKARDEAKAQLEQAQAYEPWAPVLETLQTNYGLTPEQALQYLQNPPTQQQTAQLDPAKAEADRAAKFTEFLSGKGVQTSDWWELDPNMQAYWTNEFERNERDSAAQQAQAKQQAEATQRELDLEFKGLQQNEKYQGWVKDPVLGDLVRLGQSYGFSGQQLAEKLHGSIETLVQARLVQYQTGKLQDATVPVVTGGNSPTPTQKLDLQDRAARLAVLNSIAQNTPV